MEACPVAQGVHLSWVGIGLPGRLGKKGTADAGGGWNRGKGLQCLGRPTRYWCRDPRQSWVKLCPTSRACFFDSPRRQCMIGSLRTGPPGRDLLADCPGIFLIFPVERNPGCESQYGKAISKRGFSKPCLDIGFRQLEPQFEHRRFAKYFSRLASEFFNFGLQSRARLCWGEQLR